MYLFIRLLKPFRGYAEVFFELQREVVTVVEAAGFGYFGYGGGVELLKHLFRFLQSQNVEIFAEIKACFLLEDAREMLGADKVPIGDLRESDLLCKVGLQVFERVVYIMSVLLR